MQQQPNKHLLHKLLISSIIFISSIAFSETTLTDQQYEVVLQQLKRDRVIINENNIRWHSLRTSKPEVEYTVGDDNKVIVQKITIPISGTTPLVYQMKFEVTPPVKPTSFIPLKFFLCGMLETTTLADAKLGLQVFSLSPLKWSYVSNISANVLVGVRSFGTSVSYTLPKPMHNTSIHVYSGFSYQFKKVFGVGVSLNF